MGVTGFILERGFAGLTVGPHAEKMGLRTSPMGDVILETASSRPRTCWATEGDGSKIFTTVMEWERTCILASWLGAQQRQLERCVEYAQQRRQFGRPSAVSRLSRTKLPTCTCAWRRRDSCCTRPPGCSAAASPPCGGRDCQALRQPGRRAVALDAMQVHGGYGYMTELELERAARDAIGGTMYSGTSEIQHVLIASQLGLG